MTMPAQKPGKSEQAVGTPERFLEAVRQRLGIREFAVDLAASLANTACGVYFTEETDSLRQPWHVWANPRKGWGWLNPPFGDITPWAEKAWNESRLGAQVAMLVPASPGSTWWIDHVRGKGYITYLQGRMAFVGHKDYYPKDLALILYAPYLEGGSCSWKWAPKRLRRVK